MVWKALALHLYDSGCYLLHPQLMLVVCGLPLFFLELTLGQYSASGPLKVGRGREGERERGREGDEQTDNLSRRSGGGKN